MCNPTTPTWPFRRYPSDWSQHSWLRVLPCSALLELLLSCAPIWWRPDSWPPVYSHCSVPVVFGGRFAVFCMHVCAVLASEPCNYRGGGRGAWPSGVDCDTSWTQVSDEEEARGVEGAGEWKVGLNLVSILYYLCSEWDPHVWNSPCCHADMADMPHPLSAGFAVAAVAVSLSGACPQI